MAKYSKTMLTIASKLGLVAEDKILSKAAEFERLLQTKSFALSNMTDTGRIVICLDLAANMLGGEFDAKLAIKYSGLKGPTYANCKKMVQNILELNPDRLTISLLCVTMQCGGAQELADKILHLYQKSSKVAIDLNLPQYVCMAVYQACRINKIKITKNKLIEKSRLKPSQWNKLDADWTKFVDENFTVVKKKRGVAKTPAKDERINVEHMEVVQNQAEVSMEPQMESYDDWKKRILEAAYKELRELDQKEYARSHMEQVTPRRSPRKTPQKFSPYKSPIKGRGVKLLFL